MTDTTSWTGLAARSWDALGGDEPQTDYAPLLRLLQKRRGRTLDIGCGTGRLLVRFLREGIAVDGVDTSADMLELCRAKAEGQGLDPTLFHQSMAALDLDERYHTVLIPCGSFMLLCDDSVALDALTRIRDHLAHDGQLCFNVFGPSRPPSPEIGVWKRRREGSMADGTRVTMDIVVDEHDVKRQVIQSRRRYIRTSDGEVVEEEELIDTYRWYSPAHVLRLLAAAGYSSQAAHGDYECGAILTKSEAAIFTAAP